MKKFTLKLIIITFIIFAFMKCNNPKEAPKDVTIVAVNDIHAALDNFPRFAYLVDSLRGVYPDLILVSAGDNQTGNPVNDQYPNKGIPVVELMNEIGFDLTCVGNHEFDLGQEQFSKLKTMSNFDMICANYYNPKYKGVNVKPYKIITTKNDVKLVFLGLLQINDRGIPDTHPQNVKDIIFKDPIETALQYKNLKDSCDVFIALTHLGFEDDMQLAKNLKGKELDLIIGGQSNTLIEKKEVYYNTMITQVDWKLNYASLIKIKVQGNKVIDKKMELFDMKEIKKESPKVREIVNKYNNNPELNKVIAQSDYALQGKEPLGFLMTDALRELSGVDIVFQNPGGVRTTKLEKGNITIMDVYKIDPFNNEFMTLYLTGEEITDFLKLAFRIDVNEPEFVSGANVKYILNADKTLNDVEVTLPDGSPLLQNETYKVGMNSYIVTAYNFSHKDPGRSLFKITAEYVVDYLKQVKKIKNYQEEKRISFVTLK